MRYLPKERVYLPQKWQWQVEVKVNRLITKLKIIAINWEKLINLHCLEDQPKKC